MADFERPSGAYTGSSGSNRTKYQDDATAVPKRAISSSKIDGDFNYILDALNAINGYNASGAYADLETAVAQVRQNQLDIAAIVSSGFISPSGTNVAAYSADGVSWISGKLPSAVFRDSAGLSVVARSANSTGSVADLTATADGNVLYRSGSNLVFAALPSSAVTFSNTASGMSATTVQGALDELDGRLDNLSVTGTFALAGDISPAQLTANTDNWAPTGLSSASTIRFSTDASRNLTGITGGADGRILTLVNVGSFPLVLTNDATSTAANRFLLPAASSVSIPAGGSVVLQYDSTSSRWRLLATSAVGLVAKIQRFISLSASNQAIGATETVIDGASFTYTALSATNKVHMILDLSMSCSGGGEFKLRINKDGTSQDATMAGSDKIGVILDAWAGRTLIASLTPGDTSSHTYTVSAQRIYNTGTLNVNSNNYHTALFIEEVA